MPFRRAAILAFVLASLVLVQPHGAHAADTIIQPGAPVYDVSAQSHPCTLGFVLRAPNGKLYITTAGHCANRIGDRMGGGDSLSLTHDPFGTVVFLADVTQAHVGGFNPQSTIEDDVALISIDDAKVPLVNPAVRSWGGPTGYTRAASSSPDIVRFYGYGAGLGYTEATRPRAGILLEQNANSYRADMPAVIGDSGGPLIDSAGKAIGLISHSGIAPTFGPVPLPNTDIGPTVERILKLLDTSGYKLSLVTAAA